MIKRKKWTEEEEETLISKYSELLQSGTLAKLKSREKKFEPIADHVNSVHHLQDPLNFPFQWTWRDVSIKVQNMRHQYLGVKQKIRLTDDQFNWKDAENHWQNFLKYKEVFGDLELEVKDTTINDKHNQERGLLGDENDEDDGVFGFVGDASDVLGLGLGIECEGLDGDDDQVEAVVASDGDFGGGVDEKEEGDSGFVRAKRLKKKGFGDGEWGDGKLGLVGTRLLELREVGVRREERKREREFEREEEVVAREESRKEREIQREERRRDREEWARKREFEWEERQRIWWRREFERRLRVEREFDEERWRRMKMEEKREEEEMEWRERMVGMQIEHEKQMMQMHADACHNQMQILGILVRLVCQFYGSGNDGLGGGLGALPPQVLQNLQHPGSLVGDNGKADANSAAHFM
ncbi:uncharacterized protein LOC143845580 [Tasmannia lanceolata]|uniref:uncharacterized protein LOC143845580 n=1 Tax=Tasmannia lanceolata TaxID=3420 RepID=UPI0040636716